jgi:prepilin signal peptidase PulO-like enzyme (type II secretory pathway)
MTDLIPLVSFFRSAGKCRYCHTPIGASHLALEIGAALVSIWTAWTIFIEPMTIGYIVVWAIISVFLWLLILYDISTMYLHEPVWLLVVLLTALLVYLAPAGSRYYVLIW